MANPTSDPFYPVCEARFGTTICYEDNAGFDRRADVIEPPRPVKEDLIPALRVTLGLLRMAWRGMPLFLDSTNTPYYPDLLAAAIISLWPRRRRPPIAFMGDMWEPNQGLRGRMEALLIRLSDRAVRRWIVQSSEELMAFPRLWGVDPARMRLCLYFASLTPPEMSQEVPQSGCVWAGGNSQRDYAPLVEAARRMPEQSFVIATKRLNGVSGLPPNVKAGPVPHEEFVRQMAGAAAVVVPIQQGLHRAAGQQTYLNAMLLGKPTIVNRVYGVADHIRDGETGLIVDGSAEGYVAALQRVLDPARQEETGRIAAAGQRAVQENNLFEHHAACLLEHFDEMLHETGLQQQNA